MTDDDQFSNDLVERAEFDGALADLEQALMRFERLITRHSLGLRTASSRTTSKRGIIYSALGRLGQIILGGGGSQNPISLPHQANSSQNSRFPTPNGQFMADLASMLQRMSGRNL